MTADAERPYAGNAEHLLAEIGWLDLLVRRQILGARSAQDREQGDPFKGLYISDREVARLVAEQDRGETDEEPESRRLIEQAAALRRAIDQRKRASLAAGVHLALAYLAAVFDLTPLEERIVLLALASEIDAGHERIFAWLQDDISRKRPCVDLAMRLFCADAAERMAARAVFAADAPLGRARLLRRLDVADGPLLGRPLQLTDATADFLLADARGPAGLPAGVYRFATRRPLSSLRWGEAMRVQLAQFIRAHIGRPPDATPGMILHLQGARGSGRKTLAACLCGEIEARLLVADVQLLMHGEESFEEALRAIFRHGLLHRCAVHLEQTAPLFADDDKGAAARATLRRVMRDLSRLTFIATESPWTTAELFPGFALLTVELPMPDIAGREALWETFAGESRLRFAPDVAWSELAAKFRLTPGQIEGAIADAGTRARLRGPDAAVGRDDMHKGCYAQSNRKLAALARRLDARYGWEHITLPPGTLAQLHEVCAQVRHRRTVYDDWGFARTVPSCKGLAVLFHGQSGVGKTMAVEVIANDLKLEAFKIDLSTVVSKYIGETEKNLNRIFQEAESSNAILFFDEADALFGKRSEVKDAHDRYANIEINYLLQRMEEFDGLVILATNLRKNIDEGFFRRMHFAVEFPFPDASFRYRIWKQHLPEGIKLKGDIDFDYLAERFNLTGGNIRNVVVNAAFLAAADGTAIGMEHLIRATRREYEKIGRICTDMDFRPYQKWLAEAKSAP